VDLASELLQLEQCQGSTLCIVTAQLILHALTLSIETGL